MAKLPRTIRLDTSDPHVFGHAAEPGEWAVGGAFAFLNDRPDGLSGKRRQAFANGFLGLGTFGWSTFVSVASADEADVAAAVQALGAHFVAAHGAPDLAAALPVARDEVGFALDLCREHPVNTLLAVSRSHDQTGGIREQIRVIQPPRDKDHARIWAIEEGDEGP